MLDHLIARFPGRIPDFLRLVRLNRPIGIFLLLWPPLWALWMAGERQPDTHVVVIFILSVTLMRSAGCAINDFADRFIDGHVTRTKERMIPIGKITPKEALLTFAGLCGLAFILVLQLNTLTILMSLVGLALAAGYPFAKRYTYLPQVVLGTAFGWAVPMAFAAQTGGVPQVGWLLFIATLLWATAYDTMYAMVDREDDLEIGVKSTAILFAEMDLLIIGILQGLVILALLMVGVQLELGAPYYAGLTVATGLAVYEQWLIRDRNPQACFKAFLHNNWFGMAIFMGVFMDAVVSRGT